ncbi:MAG: hypothetical protein ACLPQY_28800 [Streptosporangiaceae bacterium]
MGSHAVDARWAWGVQVGQDNTQIIYNYGRLTRADEDALPPLVSVRGKVDSPYRGLRAFEEQDAPFFFGREAATTDVLTRMSRCVDRTGLLVVSGVSGAGKSSLLRAGVLPRIRGAGLTAALEAARWPCLLLTPGPTPLDVLAVQVARIAGVDAAAVRRGLDDDPARFALTARQAALAPAGPMTAPADLSAERQPPRLLLVVDQFEQVFTQCPDEKQRQAFITALCAAAARDGLEQDSAALIVLGVRADFEARCADYPELADAIQDRYLVTSMTGRQLRMAITEPAKRAGSSVDEDLIDVLLEEVGTRQPASSPAVSGRGSVSGAGILPLLSHALDQAWRSRAGDVLTIADYERTGGIEGAVADSAQRAYDHLTPSQQATARQVFMRLTATSSGGVDTADRASRAELTDGKTAGEVEDVEAVLEAFAAERLLTLATDTVEISHEVLLTAWPLLRDTWLAETHADRMARTRLHNTAADWARNSRDRSYLYSGSLLAAATETAARVRADPARYPPLTRTERDFLQASDRAHRRSVRRLQSFTAFLMVLVIGLVAATVYAFYARNEFAHERDVAVSGQLITGSESLGDANPALSKLQSIAAWRIHPTDEARYAMLAAAARPGIAALTDSVGQVYGVAFSPDGKTLASSDDAAVRLWDVATHQPIGKPFGDSNGPHAVAFSPDGKTLASSDDDGTVRLWDVATHQQIGNPFTGFTGSVHLAFSPDGKTLATGDDATVRLWNVADRQQIGKPLTGSTGPYSVAFSPDGKTLSTGDAGGTVQLWDVATHQQVGKPFGGSNGLIWSVAFSPDGKTLATGDADGAVQLWDVATHQQIDSWSTGGSVFSVAFSPDGKTLAAGSNDHKAWLWDVATGQQIGTFTGSTAAVLSVAFSPDGKTLATGSGDSTVRLWKVVGLGGIATLKGHTDTVFSVAFSRDGKTLASGSADDTVRLWDTATHQPIGSPITAHTGQVFSVAFSPDGKTLAVGGWDGTVRLWDTATHQQIGKPLGPIGSVWSVAFSPDGKTLAAGGYVGTVRLWDVATHQQIGNPLTAHTGSVRSVAFSPDGKTLVTGDNDGVMRLWDVATHRQIGNPIITHTGEVWSVAFSPDGKALATGGWDALVTLWNVATHQQIGNTLTGHTGPVYSVAFSPDGKTLASGGGGDDTVRLWDVATHQQIGSGFTGHTGEVWSVAFSPDGKTLASGSGDDSVRLWDVSYLVNVEPYLCASAGGTLTPAQWAQYAAGPGYQNVCP